MGCDPVKMTQCTSTGPVLTHGDTVTRKSYRITSSLPNSVATLHKIIHVTKKSLHIQHKSARIMLGFLIEATMLNFMLVPLILEPFVCIMISGCISKTLEK